MVAKVEIFFVDRDGFHSVREFITSSIELSKQVVINSEAPKRIISVNSTEMESFVQHCE